MVSFLLAESVCHRGARIFFLPKHPFQTTSHLASHSLCLYLQCRICEIECIFPVSYDKHRGTPENFRDIEKQTLLSSKHAGQKDTVWRGENRVDRNEAKINDDLREDTKTKITGEKYCWYIFVDPVIRYRLMIEQKSFGYETIENEKNLLSSKLHVKSM